MKKFSTIAIATIILVYTFIFTLTSCGNTAETETTTVTEPMTETISETTTTTIETIPETTAVYTENLDILQAYAQGIEDDQNQWKISNDIYFIDGSFYSTANNEVIFELSSIPDMDLTSYRLLGCCSVSEKGPYYITVKSLNNIWLITVNTDLEFEFDHIANDAVKKSDKLYFNRTDRFGVTYNNDAVQYLRTVIYHSGVTGHLVQIDIVEEGFNKKSINLDIENPVLITDAFGVYWLKKADIETLKLSELIETYHSEGYHPDFVVDRSGQYIKFGFSNA